MALFSVFLIPIAGWFLWLAAQAVENGVVNYRGLTARRNKQPVQFWLFTSFYVAMSAGTLIFGVMVAVGVVWPRIV